MKEVFFIVSEHNGVRLPVPKDFHIGSCIDEATVSQAIARFATDIGIHNCQQVLKLSYRSVRS